jgi:putative GTP pyrophosphokinase
MATLSKTQIDRLGNRLKTGSLSEADLRLLDEYRRSLGSAYESVLRIIREDLQLKPTGRPAKSTTSITEKLRRESIRLSQVQDIAGCRVVVANIAAQDQAVTMLRDAFVEVRVMDRRKNPSHGYRAVHVIVDIAGKAVEVQIRSFLQHLWAELSERLSDVVGLNIKYGGGDATLRNALTDFSEIVSELEEIEGSSASNDDTVSLREKLVKTLSDLIIELEN